MESIANPNKELVRSLNSVGQLRVDGRSPKVGRPLVIALGRHEGEASAELRLGRTRVLAEVKGDLVQPFLDRPSEGMLLFNVDFSPLASEAFEAGRPPPLAIELTRLIEKMVKESQAIDTEALCVINGERVWCLRVDVTVLDHDGNLCDACVIATIAALQHFRRPEVTVAQHGGDLGHTEVTVHHSDEKLATPLPIHHVPLAVTFGLMHTNDDSTEGAQALALLDPSMREEAVMAGRITFALNVHSEICAMHKLGGAPVAAGQILTLAQEARARAKDLHAWLAGELAQADTCATALRTERIRGSAFAGSRGGSGHAIEEKNEGLKFLEYGDLHHTFVTKEEGEGAAAREDLAVVDLKGSLREAIEAAAKIREIPEPLGTERKRARTSGTIRTSLFRQVLLTHSLMLFRLYYAPFLGNPESIDSSEEEDEEACGVLGSEFLQ